MKILFITPYITSAKHPAFLRNQTGLGLMVYDIAKYVGRTSDVELFAVNAFSPKIDMENFTTISRNWISFIKSLSLQSFIDGFSFISKYKLPLKEKLRVLYQFLSISQIEKLLPEYDIIHIHGCSPITDAAIKACQRKHKPFLVTLHGLVSFEKEVKLHESLKQYEKDFLIDSYKNDYDVSFISTGNKETALEYIRSQISKR